MKNKIVFFAILLGLITMGAIILGIGFENSKNTPPHIFGSYEEGNRPRVFVTTASSCYRLYDNVVTHESGGIIPAAITYLKNSDSSYSLESYTQAKDGAYFISSIKEYRKMPVSGKNIKGLEDKILTHYGNYEDVLNLNEKT